MVFRPEEVVERQRASSLAATDTFSRDRLTKALDLPLPIDISLHATRQYLSPSEIQTGARWLKLGSVALVFLLLFLLFLCQLLEMRQETGVRALDKEIHSPTAHQRSIQA